MLFSFSHTHVGQLFYLEKQLALYILIRKSWSDILIRKAVGSLHFNQKKGWSAVLIRKAVTVVHTGKKLSMSS